MFGIPILTQIAPAGCKAELIFAGDNLPEARPGAYVEFTMAGPCHMRCIANPGADTVVVWDDESLDVVRLDTEPGYDERPLVAGKAAKLFES